MDNPWKGLPVTEKEFSGKRQDFILDCDRDAVNKLNKKGLELNRKAEEKRKQGKKGAEKDFRIQTLLPPEPFAGRIDAPVVILMKMPLHTPDLDDELFRNEDFAKDLKLVREQEGDDVAVIEYPFYHLNPAYNAVLEDGKPNPGYTPFWEPKMRELIAARGLKHVSQNILLLQAFPYKTNQSIKKTVPSISYTFHILNEAMKRKALIVMLGGTDIWGDNKLTKKWGLEYSLGDKTASGLNMYSENLIVRKLKMKNGHRRRFFALSQDNIGKEGFNRILERIPSV